MSKFIDLAGQRFNRWIVINRAGNGKGGNARWNCRCDCGSEKTVSSINLKHGGAKSCGCMQRETPPAKKHGHSHNSISGLSSPTYNSWRSMNQRCTNKNKSNYKYYGGKGISVCSRWDSFANFLNDMGERPKSMTLDRINNLLGYYKENCRWATHQQQTNNQIRNRLLTFQGKTKTMAQWSRDLDIRYAVLNARISGQNWSTEKALTTPVA